MASCLCTISCSRVSTRRNDRIKPTSKITTGSFLENQRSFRTQSKTRPTLSGFHNTKRTNSTRGTLQLPEAVSFTSPTSSYFSGESTLPLVAILIGCTDEEVYHFSSFFEDEAECPVLTWQAPAKFADLSIQEALNQMEEEETDHDDVEAPADEDSESFRLEGSVVVLVEQLLEPKEVGEQKMGVRLLERMREAGREQIIPPAATAHITHRTGEEEGLSRLLGDVVAKARVEAEEEWGLRQPLDTHPSLWEPQQAKVTLNLQLDGAVVKSTHPISGKQEERWDCSGLVVLDDFISEDTRKSLKELLTTRDWPEDATSPPNKDADLSNWGDVASDGAIWERDLEDLDGLPKSWGLTHESLEALVASKHPAILEVQSRICKLYPDYLIARLPPAVLPGCAPLVANAAVQGDAFQWHIDMDPALSPEFTDWTALHGQYPNRAPGRPFFVTLLLYVDEAWPLEWDAETLILDSATDTGVMVRPRPCRALLMDQDVSHRLSPPSILANRPRYSMVWKLVFHPLNPDVPCGLARAEWGECVKFGSANP